MRFSNRRLKPYAALFCIFILSFLLDGFAAGILELIKNPLLDEAMGWFSNIFTVFFVLFLISGLFLYEKHKARHILILFLSFFISLGVAYFLKGVFMRPRPDGSNIIMLGFFGIEKPVSNHSFPSTHAAASFGVLSLLEKDFKKIRIFWLFFSVMVCVSRIYLNRHYLSDVIGGIVIGLVTGELIIFLDKKYEISARFF